MNEADHVLLERDGDAGVVVIDHPPANALGPGVREGIVAAFAAARRDAAAAGLQQAILVGRPSRRTGHRRPSRTPGRGARPCR
jgi:3-hydroxyacyl-CoA dehydrogenase